MTKSYHAPRKTQLKPAHKRPLFWAVLAGVIFSVGLVIGLFGPEEKSEEPPVAVAPEVEMTRDITLYFASGDGQALIAEGRRIAECPDENACLMVTLQELIAGPRGDLEPILPPQVAVHNVSAEESLVTIDFSQEFVNAHPGGTQSELMTIYGLADTVTVNFPHFRQVKILVEGVAVETVKGHVDLRQPIHPDFSLVEEGLVPIGDIGGETTDREE